jgi:ABC-type multidrug transport system fused ATPase/permease subunit
VQDVAQFSMMRSFRRDPTVAEQKLAPGTARRIARFASPYRRELTLFLVLIVVAAFLAVLNPLIFKKIIDDGIGTDPPATGDRGLVVSLALLVAALALVDAGLQLWSRWCSTRIGEGLIYDMRSQVYTHISRMPIAFFTRTQTGALISRLNNDVLGAQQAFTGTLSGVVSNVIGVVLTLAAMLVLSWQITLLSLVLLPVFVIPAKLIGTKLQALTRESYALNASMTNSMTERFNVSGALLVEVLDLEPMVADRPGAVPLPAGATSIEFDDVVFGYPTAEQVSLASLESVAVLDATPSTTVLRGVSFRAEPGSLVALVGPSGAGKTTISQLVTRMYDVDSGAVRLGGHDVRDVTMQSLRDAVGVVTQDAHMFHDTIRANLLYAAPDATDERLWSALDAAQVGQLVRALPDGLDTLVGDRGYRLSGGEKQRMAIARLLLKAPGVVVLDEATAHLDSESEAAVQQALSTALEGRTSLVIAHRLSTVREADQILVVEDGRVVERGRHDELLDRGGLYTDLYRRQFAAQEDEPVAVD